MSICLVAEECSTGAIAGYASVKLCQPQALLPPPFPSRTPVRLYIDGLAVAEQHRKRGLGLKLLQACERLGGCFSMPRSAVTFGLGLVGMGVGSMMPYYL